MAFQTKDMYIATYNDTTQLAGLFKEVYGEDYINLLPDVAVLAKMIPFQPKDKELGNLYHQPVVLTSEQGVTYAAPGDGAFSLDASVAMKMGDAQIQGSQMALRSSLAYEAMSKASSGNKKAFIGATELVVDNMLESIGKRLEISMLHGSLPIAEIAIGGFDETSGGATTASFVVTDASWASGIWSGSEGAKLDFRHSTSTDANTAGDAVIITAVDCDTKTISVSSSAGSIEDINDFSASYALDVRFKGSYGKEMAGLRKQIVNTGSLMNIDASAYGMWKGNAVTLSGKITLQKLLNAISKPIARGLNEKAVVLVSPVTFVVLAAELQAQVLIPSYDPKKGEMGYESLKFHAQNGELEVISHSLVKEGEIFVFPPKKVKRIGSTDVTFKTPGRNDEIFLTIAGVAGVELRCYSDQAIFVEAPARCAYITGFTNS